MYEFKEADAWDFAKQQGLSVKQIGDELRFLMCPYCRPAKRNRENLNTFSINLKNGQFKCLRESCGVSGNMVTLSRDFDFSLGNQVDEYYRPKKQFKKLNTPKEPIKPKEPAVEYLLNRGISEKIAARYEITTQTEHSNILVFPFYDEEGRMQFVKYRKTDFNKERDNNKEWCESNCKPILFGMKQCNLENKRLILTEGQIDSLSVAEAGIENAVSVPTGAKGFTWIPYCYDWMKKFDSIVVFGDFEKGKISLLEEMKSRFPNRIFHVRHEDYQGCKDANELLMKYGKEAVRKAVENAKMIDLKNIIPLSEVKSVNIYELDKLKTGINELDRCLYGGLPFGTVCIIAGKRGDGKSTLGSQIMGSAIKQGYTTFTYSGELPNYLYKNWFDFQIAGPYHITENNKDGIVNRFITTKNQELINAWYQGKAYIYDSRIVEKDEQEDLLKTIRDGIKRYGISVILLDNLMTAMYLDENRGSDKYDQQGKFVRELTRIALEFNVLILLVAHRRKNSFTTDANDEISGSGDITNLASVTLSYDRMSKDEIDKGLDTEGQRKLIIAKNRLFGKINLKGIVLDYDEKSKRIYEKSKGFTWSMGWEEEWQQVNMETPFG